MEILIEFLKWLPRYFFPKICYGCSTEGWIVCPECRPKVERALDRPICPSCNNPSPSGFVHPTCPTQGKLDGLTSYYRYNGWAKEIITQAKFGKHHNFRGLKELSSEFAGALTLQGSALLNKAEPFHNSVLVPIPLHWWRQRKRGFNQATLIAEQLSKKLALPLDQKLLKRTRYTEPQTIITSSVKLSPEEVKRLEKKYPSVLNREHAIRKISQEIAASRRLINIQGAFEMKRISDIPMSVLLVDDVWTTGATMQECCQVLKEAGVQKVWGLTLLRA